MKRFLIAAMIVAAFSLSAAVAVSADSMTGAGTAVSTDQTNGPQGWIGKTTVDLLVNMGVPTYTDQRPDGETLTYIKHMGVGMESSVDVIKRFTVDSSGKITSEQDSQS